MAYVFSGVVAPAGGDADRASLQERFGGRARRLAPPLSGWVVAFASDHDPVLDSHFDDPDALLAWSAGRSGAFVYLQVECFGGQCEQRGFVARDGEMVAEEDWGEAEHPRLALFDAAGVTSDTDRCAFLERGFFADAASGTG